MLHNAAKVLAAMSIFRAQLANKTGGAKLGRLVLTDSKLALPVACFSAALMLVLLCLAVFGQISRKASADGLLVPQGGLLSVRANDDAVIADVKVREGDRVKAGQLLYVLRFDRESVNAAGLPLSALVQQQLERERRRLIDEQLKLESGELVHGRDLDAQIKRLHRTLAIERDQRDLKKRELEQAQALYQRMRVLGKSSLSLLQIQQYEMNVLAAKSALNEAELRLLAGANELADLQRDRSRSSPQYGVKASEISRAIAINAQEIARNANQAETLIRAPQDGTVSALAFGSGQSVSKGARLLYLIPEGAELEAEVWVPGAAAANLRANATVALQLLAFPKQKFGSVNGKVVDISGAAVSTEEILQRSGIALADPAYRVSVRFAMADLPIGIHPALLKPGMPLQAELRLEQRSLWRAVLGLDALAANAGKP